MRATAFSLRNQLLEILGLAGTTYPSLFCSETLMLLESSPAAAELYAAEKQGVGMQGQKVL